MNFYYIKNGDIHGPKSLDELRELCRRGEILKETQVCTEGAEAWQPLSTFIDSGASPSEVRERQSLQSPVTKPTSATPPKSSPSPVTSASAPFRGVTSGQATAIIVILVLGFFVFPFFRSVFNLVMPAQQWEYRIVAVPDSLFDYKMKELGTQGWELVIARRASEGSTYTTTFSYEMVFKRPKRL